MSNNSPTNQSGSVGSDLPHRLSQPAKRALAQAGITRLEQLTTYTARQISELHGIGPSAMIELRIALKNKGWGFADEA